MRIRILFLASILTLSLLLPTSTLAKQVITCENRIHSANTFAKKLACTAQKHNEYVKKTVKERSRRKGRNPQTGKEIKIPGIAKTLGQRISEFASTTNIHITTGNGKRVNIIRDKK